MITYNPAFDLYHTIWRMAHILQRLESDEAFEVERLRIWDFYLLFPAMLYEVRIGRSEQELNEARKTYISRTHSPYEYEGDRRKLFEWLHPVQSSAMSCLVSCGILSKEAYLVGRISIVRPDVLTAFIGHSGKLTSQEQNTLSFLRMLSRHVSLSGNDGLKARTHLLEYKYDAD